MTTSIEFQIIIGTSERLKISPKMIIFGLPSALSTQPNLQESDKLVAEFSFYSLFHVFILLF